MKKSIFWCIFIALFFIISCSNESEHVVVSHPNGKPAFIEYYTENDTLHPCRTLRYYINGEKQEEVHYNNGIKEGINTFWYQNGEKMFEGNYKNGLLEGTFTQWFDNGKVDYIAKYEKGRPTGTWKYYSKDGKLISEQKMQ
ncbi:MAG: hypothetical protein II663_06185 [Bacteroidales bacterium]|nr:hypothetical protein [Bacteroidales bacterium]MBQ4215842.1 hypothetical protein [Bacteroidales bacterium]MBR4498331.1 hypothetical protein [Bacteroidales bacterium]